MIHFKLPLKKTKTETNSNYISGKCSNIRCKLLKSKYHNRLTKHPIYNERKKEMKVKCKSCGKFFDYENYYGICPKCGAYYGAKEQLSETFEIEEELLNQTSSKNEVQTNCEESTYEEKKEYKITDDSEIKYPFRNHFFHRIKYPSYMVCKKQ